MRPPFLRVIPDEIERFKELHEADTMWELVPHVEDGFARALEERDPIFADLRPLLAQEGNKMVADTNCPDTVVSEVFVRVECSTMRVRMGRKHNGFVDGSFVLVQVELLVN
jgi:hypothetical protein